MYLSVKQQLNHLSKEEYLLLKELSHLSKNMYNVALYNIRQHFFATGKYLTYNKNYHECKSNENYKLLNSNMAQQIIKNVASDFSSFFELLKLKNSGAYNEKVRIPNYKEKDGYFKLVIGQIRIKDNQLTVPLSQLYNKTNDVELTIKMPPILKNKTIKQIEILPKFNARSFEVQYTYEEEITSKRLNPNNALAIDLGVSNLMTCVSNNGDSFIIDGKKLKAKNQWFNKRNAYLQSLKDKQHQKELTHQQVNLWRTRNNQINDYISKACLKVVKYCVAYDIGTLVLGYNKTIQKEVNIGRANNQNFVNIPIGQIKNKLTYLCAINGIDLVLQEESYTSKASFFDGDVIPVYDPKVKKSPTFSGTRIKRGLYKTKSGYGFNADVNAALNILSKSKATDLTVLRSRGKVFMPLRIAIV